MPRKDIIAASLANRGIIAKTRSLGEACEIANRIAPGASGAFCGRPEMLLPLLRHAGAIFMGYGSSESIGDYVAGTNHVLPTSRSARFSSPLGVYDFKKRTSLIYARLRARRSLGQAAATRSLTPRACRRMHGSGTAIGKFFSSPLWEGRGGVVEGIFFFHHYPLPLSHKGRRESKTRHERNRIHRQNHPARSAGVKAYPVTPPWTGIKIELMEDNHLDAANNTATSRAMRDAIARAVADAAFNRYPDPAAPALKAKLREKGIAPEHGIPCSAPSDEVISMVSQALLAAVVLCSRWSRRSRCSATRR